MVGSKTDQRRRYLQSWVVVATQSEKRCRGDDARERDRVRVCMETQRKEKGRGRHSGNLDRCRVIKSRPPPSPLRLLPGFSRISSSRVSFPSVSSFSSMDRISATYTWYSQCQNDRNVSVFVIIISTDSFL